MIEYGNKFDSLYEYLITRFGTGAVKDSATGELPYILVVVNLKETCLILEEFSEWVLIEKFEVEDMAHVQLTDDFKDMVMFKLL